MVRPKPLQNYYILFHLYSTETHSPVSLTFFARSGHSGQIKAITKSLHSLSPLQHRNTQPCQSHLLCMVPTQWSDQSHYSSSPPDSLCTATLTLAPSDWSRCRWDSPWAHQIQWDSRIRQDTPPLCPGRSRLGSSSRPGTVPPPQSTLDMTSFLTHSLTSSSKGGTHPWLRTN